MSGRSENGSHGGPSPSDGLLTVAVLVIALIRGVARRPPAPDPATTPAERVPRRSGRAGGLATERGAAPGPRDFVRADAPDRGRNATTPSQIPMRGYKDVASRVVAEVKADNVPLLAAGVAFYSVLALFPALVAVVSIYGLVAEPAEVSSQLAGLTSALPPEAGDLIVDQIKELTASDDSSLGLSAAIGIGLALWSASSGMSWLLKALSLVYDEVETRKFVPLRARALVMTAGAVVGLVVSLLLIAGASSLADRAGFEEVGQFVVSVLRWPLLGMVMIVGLAVLYRYGPDRDAARWRWVSWGSVVGMVIWLIASAGFAVYVAVAGSNESYGSLAGVIVLMLWLWLSVLSVLLGGQVNAELEHQTAQDTTTGPDQPLGHRDAVMADTVGPDAQELAQERLDLRSDEERKELQDA